MQFDFIKRERAELDQRKALLDEIEIVLSDAARILVYAPEDIALQFRNALASLSEIDRDNLNLNDPKLPSPTEAVFHVMRRNPQGLLPTEIMSLLEGRFATKSSDPNKVLNATVSQLYGGGRLAKNPADGRYFLPEREREEVDPAKYATKEQLHILAGFMREIGILMGCNPDSLNEATYVAWQKILADYGVAQMNNLMREEADQLIKKLRVKYPSLAPRGGPVNV